MKVYRLGLVEGNIIDLTVRGTAAKRPPLADPDRSDVRYVRANGGIRWNRQWVNVSICCAGEYVGLAEIDDSVWNVDFGPLTLGRLLERHMRIKDTHTTPARYPRNWWAGCKSEKREEEMGSTASLRGMSRN